MLGFEVVVNCSEHELSVIVEWSFIEYNCYIMVILRISLMLYIISSIIHPRRILIIAFLDTISFSIYKYVSKQKILKLLDKKKKKKN
jgi:hypothetical protein